MYAAFLLTVGFAYLMALAYLYYSHQGHDGKPGLSVTDIVDNYYGNRSGTRLEAAIRGPMAGYIETEDRHQIVEWLKSGKAETTYETRIRPILAKKCLACHSPSSGLKVPDLSSFPALGKVTKVDTGESLLTLVKLSHIHLFGIGLVLLSVGLIFRLSAMSTWLKGTLILLPFAAMAVDILAWFLTKWDPVFAYTVIMAGGLLGAGLAAQILISLYQIFFLKGINHEKAHSVD